MDETAIEKSMRDASLSSEHLEGADNQEAAEHQDGQQQQPLNAPSEDQVKNPSLTQHPQTIISLPPSPLHLPHLVHRKIASHLTHDLPTLLSLASLNSTLRRISRLYISQSFHTIIRDRHPPLSSHHLHHDLLWMILHDYLDPTAILDFTFYEQWEGKPPKTSKPGYFVGKASVEESERFFELVRGIVCESPWIPNGRKDEVYYSFREGDRDAALAILLPLCTRLKAIDAPVLGMPLCAAVFLSIAQEYQRRGTDPVQARRKAQDAARRDRDTYQARIEKEQLPFTDLLILCTQAAEYGLGPRLSECLPFMAIPSLQRIILRGLREQEIPRHFPGWPSDCPKFTAPEIYFQQSHVSKQVVRAFAQELRSPCEILQWFEAPEEGGGPEHADWDRVVVDGNGSLHITMKFGGGNPGCEHAWVSWLFWEKMRDWKRLDEEFMLEEGDEEIPELDWNFGRY